MRIPFRQGLVKYQTDIANNPTFLQLNPIGGDMYVNLVVSPTPLLCAFADGAEDYLNEEQQNVSQAWGPFAPGTDYWLYVDINTRTGVRTFGSTLYEPIYSRSEPILPSQDQHWFDRRDFTMRVRVGARWSRRVRVFVGKLVAGTVLEPEDLGTQANLNFPVRAGFLLFDNDDDPVQKAGQFNRGKFLTTDSPLASQLTGSANFRLEGLITTGTASQNMAPFTCVRYTGDQEIGAADPVFFDDACVGVINEEATVGSVNRIVTRGYVTDENFNFNLPAGTCLFVGTAGLITSSPSQQFSIQQVGFVVSPKTILIELGPHIRYA